MNQIYDLLVIGGGINGSGCAMDAATRGLSVCLVEQYDLSSQTSSRSSKLIHGGLRYLEYYEFKLVKKALDERERLLKLAPHLMRPIPCILIDKYHKRSNLLSRIGLWLYDHLGFANSLPRSMALYRKKEESWFTSINSHIKQGFLYYDLVTNDARLVIENCLLARSHKAQILTHSKVLSVQIQGDYWETKIINFCGTHETIISKAIINASGPWVSNLNQTLNIPDNFSITLIKGSHIVLPKFYLEDRIYVLQQADNRIIFTIPYYDYTLVGTTEELYNANPEQASINHEEINYLLNAVNNYFIQQYNPHDIVHTFSGVRPLLSNNSKNPSSLSRDYSMRLANTRLPYLSIYGGKITTYRQLAEDAINQLKPYFPQMKPCVTRFITLPGGQNNQEFSEFAWLPTHLLQRYRNIYGSRINILLSNCKSLNDLGMDFGYGLFQREIDYLIQEEWARTAEDILWRRTKLGLQMNEEQVERIKEYIVDKAKIQ